MRSVFLACCLVATVASTSASAQVYAGAELGFTSAVDNTQNVANTLTNAVGGSVSVTQDKAVTTGRFFLGYEITENIAAELGYIQSGNLTTNVAGVSGGSVAYTGKGTVSVNGADYSVLIRPSKSSGLNGLFLRLGGTSYTESASFTLTGTSTASASASTSGSGTIWGFGYDQQISDKLAVRYAYTGLNKIANTSDTANVFSVGAVFKF